MKKFILHKKDGRNLVPWEFLVDDTSHPGKLVIVSEKVLDTPPANFTPVVTAVDPRAAELKRKGYKFEFINGQLHILSVPQRYIQFARILSSPDAECFSPECEAIQKEYHEKREKLVERPNCPDCEKGALYKKYEEKLDKILPE